MKAKTFLVADTETVGLGRNAFVFDFAYVISTRKSILVEKDFIIREVITNPRIMLYALQNEEWRQTFGGKIFSHYIPKLAKRELKIFGWREMIQILRDDMYTHDVDVFSAYNLKFDMGALGRTQHFVCDGGKVLNFKPDLLDLWKFACITVCRTKLYHETCRQYGQEFNWITPANNVKTTAEKVYAFLSGDHGFIEEHTALADARIETEILQRLLALKKRIPYNDVDHMPWRHAQTLHGKMF